MRSARWLIAAALPALGCSTDNSNVVRGRGMATAPLSAADEARIYEAAARAAFDVTDPTLSLLIDPRELPRVVGLAPEGRLADSVVGELRSGRVIKGSCEPPITGTVGAPQCKADMPGYVLRFSPVFAIHGDSMQVYVFAQQYRTAQSGVGQRLRFERAYQVLRQGDGWTAVREGRVPKEIRGEPK